MQGQESNPVGEGILSDVAVPIPIQIFLWRQVSPFVRPKLGKLHEASCMFCQHAITGHHELKEACKNFEKVLVQNLFSGLKKDLTEAVKTIPRWKLIQSALPHVMHAVQSVLHNRMRDGNLQNLGALETKLLYTLHWILLDAAEECADTEFDKDQYHLSHFHYLFSVPTITLFVYLFAPLCQNLKESDFQNFRLENGMKIWQPMWEFRHPEANCFVSHCKPKPKFLHNKNKWKSYQFDEVFVGVKHNQESNAAGNKDSPTFSHQPAGGTEPINVFNTIPPTPVTVVTATITQKGDDEVSWVSSPKDTVFPETIPEESSSTEEEHVVIFSLPPLNESDGFLVDPSIYTAETSLIQLAMRRSGRTNNVNKVKESTECKDGFRPPMQKIGSSTDKDSIDSGEKKPEQPAEHAPKFGSHHIMDLAAATFLDVGVLRCLFITDWQEEGIYWALHFLYNRLRDIHEESAAQHQPRKRSNSLPIPKIEVSFYQNNENKKTENNNKDFIEVPELKDVSLLAESPYITQKQTSDESLHKRTASEKSRRRMKIADLKAFVETKLLSKSDKALEKIGQDDPKPLDQSQPVRFHSIAKRILDDYHRSLDTTEDMTRKGSTHSKSFEPVCSNLVKGKSMPSLRFMEEHRWDVLKPNKPPQPQVMANPIITVTEHTPTPSPDFLRRQGSIDSQDGNSLTGHVGRWQQERKSSLARSQTDSNITYTGDEIPEAPGSICYITKDGDIDFNVVLKAVYRTSLRENSSCTLRVLEVILNLLELLLDMGILKQQSREETHCSPPGDEGDDGVKKTEKEKIPPSNTYNSFGGDSVPSEQNMSPHKLAMGTIVRVLKHLGCPHGCADGQRGPAAEFLRTQCQNILTRLHKSSQKNFKSFLKEYIKKQPLTEIMEVFHAYLGYCIDPTSLLSPLTVGGAGGVKGIEGHTVSYCFKSLMTRFVDAVKEIRSHDNIVLYSEIRQLITYVKEGHGGAFRRVALSALIDTAEKNNKKEGPMQTTRVIRHLHQSTTNVDENEIDLQGETTYTIDEKGVVRKLLLKKRSTSSTCASLLETETEDVTKTNQSPLGNLRKKHHILTPRQSEKALGIAVESTGSLKSQKKSKIGSLSNWFKKGGESQSMDEIELQPNNGDSFNDSASFIRQASSTSKYCQHKQSGRSHVSHTLQKAKRRIDDKLKFLKKGKKKDGSAEDSSGGSKYFSRKNSFELGENSRESEVVFLKERKLIETRLVYKGMQRFSFLLETCPPGTVPDAFLLGSVLDLPHAVVVARAALLLECAYFVHCCNKGQWPASMKMSFPMFRPSGPLPTRGASHAGNRRSHIIQRAAGKMFHQWAEVIGHRLEEMIAEDHQLQTEINNMVADPDKQKELQIQDEEEDYLDEASIYAYGSKCPMPLRLIACVLLQEITTFLRETYQNLPKSSKIGGKERPPPWEKYYSKEANRRWSMALSSMGHSQTSAQSLQSIAGDRDPNQTERKISFVLHEPDESEGSSNTTMTMQTGINIDDGKKNQGRPYLLRRGTAATGGGSFKRRSLKLRRGTKEGKDMEFEWRIPESVKRTDSIQSKRKVSSLSDRSDTSEPGIAGEVSGEESPGVLSDDQPPESPSDSNESDDTNKNMPWLKVMVQIPNNLYYYCTHQNFCHPFCHRRVMRGCSRLVKAVRKVYGEEFGVIDDKLASAEVKKKTHKKDKNNRKVSDQTSSQVSPIRRKDSMGKRDRIDKNLDGSQASKLASKESSRDIAESDGGNGSSRHSDDAKPTDCPPILKYLQTQVKDAFHAPLSALLKGAVILTEENFAEIIPVAWELLLEMNQEVAAAAASLFILAAIKAPTHVTEVMQQGLTDADAAIRINAILRFQVLWKLRFQVWPRMEENAHSLFKIPPPGIEFTLPSPKIGIESLKVVDSPWQLLVKTKVEEVTINQERHRSLVTATKTRKKQQTELIKMALQAKDDKKREQRENFLITTIPITLQAGHGPSLHHAPGEEHVEQDADNEDNEGQTRSHHLHSTHSLFPSCLCAAVISIVNLLDDAAVSADGCAVYEVAYSVIWTCLVEDSALFLRYVLERLTRDKQEEMFKILRHLIRFIPKLPQQAAFALYNYIIGYVMFYVRTPHEDGQQLIGSALSLLWMVVHSVHGIMFKDLKQILRKEQCDASILLTANVPSAKKIIVHGPQDPDAGGIPSQFPVQEDTQFCQILREALDFFGIEESKHEEYFLVDYKTHQIRNPTAYVRDYYFFKRSQYPQLELVHMEPDKAFHALQKQELVHKFVESGKVLLTWAILKNVDMVVQRVVFLHEELMKLPSFPRKALESDLHLYKSGPLGKELLGLDVLHKFMWVRLIARMFEAMAGNFAYSGDIHLFVNVLNGALILHSEDACILRYVMATYINAAFHFKNIFSTNGYLLIMPTLLKIYSNHQTNKLVTTTIEYAVKEFYTMNRKPFILQMFGSVSAMLDTDEDGTYGNAHKIQSSCLFNLLLSLETPSPDPLNIAELVKEPVRAIDFCYHDEDNDVTVLDCIAMCVMVVSYSAESRRGYQMLVILEAILPYYVDKIQNPVYIANSIKRFKKNERDIINQLGIAVRCLIENCAELTKVYNGPYRSSPEHKGSSQRNYRGPYSPGFDFEDDSHSKFMSEHNRAKSMYEHDTEDSETLRADYRRPRDVLLSLVGEFVYKINHRIADLLKKETDGKPIEILDCRSHVRLVDIAHALLKVSPYDPESMACRGLQYYMSYVLPCTDWGDDAMRPAFITLIKRMEKVFIKVQKKASIRRNTDWDAAAGLLKGLYNTMVRYPYIINWHQIKQLIIVCQSLIVTECTVEGVSGATAALLSQAPPPNFCSMVVRLIALQIQDGQEYCTLEQVCGGSTFPTQERTESIIINLIMPLCLRVGSGRRDIPGVKASDVSFAITLILHAMSPPSVKAMAQTGTNPKGTAETRTGSLTFTGTRDTKTASKINTSLYQVSFLALKMIALCFEEHLINDWIKIGRTMRELGKRNEAANFLWDFLDFVVTHRTPLYILMQPFIFLKLAQPPISDFERNMHQTIRDKIRSIGLPLPKSKGAVLMELANEMKQIKEDMSESTLSDDSKKENAQPTFQMTSETTQRSQRQSLIGLLTGELHQRSSTHEHLQQHLKGSSASTSHASTPVQKTTAPTEEFGTAETAETVSQDRSMSQRSSGSDDHPTQPPNHHPTPPPPPSSSSHKPAAHKLRFVSSVEFRHCSGETSTTPLSPSSPNDDDDHRKSRLQRMMPQSRKTFRLRSKSRSKRSSDLAHLKLESEPTSPLGSQIMSPPPQIGFSTSLQMESTQPYSPLSNESPKTPTAPPLSPQVQPPHVPLIGQFSNQSVTSNDSLKGQSSFGAIDPHRLRIAVRGKSAEGSWDEDSAISQTSSTSGYKESYPMMLLKDPLETSPKTFPPLASPDLHSLPSTSSAATNNFLHIDSSPDCSLNDNGEKTALLEKEDHSSSKDSLPMFDQDAQDETTLL